MLKRTTTVVGQSVRAAFLICLGHGIGLAGCAGGSNEYRLGEVTLGMSLQQVQTLFPNAKLVRVQTKAAGAMMLGRLTIAGYDESSISFGQSGQDFVVVSVATGPNGPAWDQIREDLKHWNGSPDFTWRSGEHESLVWGGDSAPEYDGSISAQVSRHCSGRCLIATRFAGWTEMQLIDVPFLKSAGL